MDAVSLDLKSSIYYTWLRKASIDASAAEIFRHFRDLHHFLVAELEPAFHRVEVRRVQLERCQAKPRRGFRGRASRHAWNDFAERSDRNDLILPAAPPK